MRWGRMWLIIALAVVSLFALMFYSGMFMHGDP